jgi:transcriptional regulator with XRE-family HTH domain
MVSCVDFPLKSKIKQQDFADKINYKQSYISMILNGIKKSPSHRFFDAVYHQFSVNPPIP